MSITLSRVYRLARTLLMGPINLQAIHKIKKSGMFDRTFYNGVNPGLSKLYRILPERHYLLFGESAGLQPNPDFSPKAYLRHNHDLDRNTVRPLLHYIQHGQFEDRLIKDLPTQNATHSVAAPKIRRKIAQKHSVAVVAHLYYHDLWPEFAHRFQSQDFDFDLFVTLTYQGESTEDLKATIEETFPNATVVITPNQGRDILPFLLLINAELLGGYDAVCKIHSKKSPHRQDGEQWRTHLIDGVLPPKGGASLLQNFLSHRFAEILVADGQHYTGTKWWGSNFDKVATLLRRVEIEPNFDNLSFPAGSIYWLKPLMVDMLRGLRLSASDFDTEVGQTDGTLAHAFERALGALPTAAGRGIVQTSQMTGAVKLAPSMTRDQPPKPKFTQAFYLPQFYPTKENDEWWGKGYTEWRAVCHARPAFAGHQHPALPADLGFYDLRMPETLAEQAAIAKAAGVDAFCVYHYWFDGKRVLEEPIDRLLSTPDVDFPFYFCWANESWRRNWDGLSGEILLDQTYADGFEEKLAADMLPYFQDPRYQRPDGMRPRFMIYRPSEIPNPEASIKKLRQHWHDMGVGDVELGAVCFHVSGESAVAEDLFDFWVEMPPHGLIGSDDYLFGGPDAPRLKSDTTPGFEGLIYDYTRAAKTSVSDAYVAKLPRNTIAGIMPSWDNTARRGLNAHIAYGANPASFQSWLETICDRRIKSSYRGELFVNAWNEWAEKAILEPTEQYGTAYLRALAHTVK